MDISEWMAEDGWFSFSHKSSEDYLKPFEESWDHMGIWLTQEFMNKKKNETEIRDIILHGMESRLVNGVYLRHSKSTTPMKLDQMDFMYPLMCAVGLKVHADNIIKQCGGFMLPHSKDHFTFTTSKWGRRFEIYDAMFDKAFSSSEVSSMNNIARLLWSAYSGHRNGKAIWVLKSWQDPYWLIVVYGARRPEDGAGKTKAERRELFDTIYMEAVLRGPNEKSPPPIYEGYKSLCLSFL